MGLRDCVEVIKLGAEDLHNSACNHLKRIDPVLLVAATAAGTIIFIQFNRMYSRSEKPLHKRLAAYAFKLLRKIPAVEQRIQKELVGPKADVFNSIQKYDSDKVFLADLPKAGLDVDEIEKAASRYEAYGTFNVNAGKVSGTVYTDRSDDHLKLLSKIYERYAYSNPLHPDVFPGVRKMEAEVIRIVLNLYHAPETASGSLSSGGTESIILACFAYRNAAQARGIAKPVILCSVTAHAAFDKAAHLCGMSIRHVPVDGNNRVDLKAMKKMLTKDVCVIVASAPNYPSGTLDPVREVAELGASYGVGVHVDACLGGFLIPFMEEAGFPMEPFDFRLPGVTSISCDTHKYGCTPKGSSIVMYRTQELHHHQFFSVPEWCGGIYATPTIAGSRAGANAAVAWATLLYFGRNEYVHRCKKIVSATRKIAKGVAAVPGLKLLGQPDVSVVAFRSADFNIYAVSDRMHKKGYNLNTLQNPDAIHVCLTYNHTSDESVDAFIADLKVVCREVSELPDKGAASGTAALYGMAATIPDKSLVDEMTFAYLDACYARPPAIGN